MKLLEAWHLSRLPYKEVVYKSIAEERGRMWWGGFVRGHLGSEAQNDHELTKKALRIAKFDKSLVAIFNVIVAIIPFTTEFFGSPIFGLTSSISLSLAITFGFTAIYAIQTLSSFVNAESYALLSTLPLEQTDLSLITLFSFVRSVDYIVVGSTLGQVIMVTFYTGSPFAVLTMLVASVSNSILAVAVALWFSRIFTKNLSRGGRSIVHSALRLVFILIWGSLLMGVGLLISLPLYIVPSLEMMLLSSKNLSNMLFCFLYPFSAGVTIVNVTNPVTAVSTSLIAATSMIGYFILAGFTGKWMLKTIKRISTGTDLNVIRVTTKNFSIKSYNPLFGYLLKDLRTFSRNPSTALFFALPVLETIMMSLLMANFEVLRASTILASTFMGGIFVLLMPLALLNAEGKGLEYAKTLPMNMNRIITSKTLITTLAYSPVPLVLLTMSFLKPLTTSLIILIPFFIILSIASASIFEIQLFLTSVAGGKIAALIRDLKKLAIGVTALVLPLIVYTVAYIVSSNHFLAVLGIGSASASELVLAFNLLRHNKNRA